jgi:type II secretory pathway pseudopilin PulG
VVAHRALRNGLAHHERGFTYLALLLVIAILGIGLTVASEIWVATARSQKMAELEWIGAQYTQAIGSYYEASPGSVKVYPPNLEELLEDHRYLTIRRHLRTAYLNPFTGKADWERVVSPDGRVRGLHARVLTDEGSEVREFVYLPK